jgi:predicted NUDIX family phosphoesterase
VVTLRFTSRKKLDDYSCPAYDLIVNENVLVVSASGIAPLLQGSFSVHNLDRCLEYILGNHSFRSRAIVEEDPSFKQIIPYVVVRHGDRYLLTRRTERQTERRLHGKYSLGIGGHINDLENPDGVSDVIRAGLERELNEEVRILGKRLSLDLVGVISDDTTPVGKVHLGLVFILQTDTDQYSIQEADLMTAEWASVEFLREKVPMMETWSQIVFANLIASTAASLKSQAIGTQ